MPIQTIIVRLATPISSGAVHAIDLGLVNLRDAAIYGRTRPLIPYAEGRLIKSVRFIPNGLPSSGNIGQMSWFFSTPNTVDVTGNGAGGFGGISIGNHIVDTLGLMVRGGNTGVDGLTSDDNSFSQICDCGPLFFGPGNADTCFLPMETWQANHAYCGQTYITDGDTIWFVTVGGVSGGSKPNFAIATGDLSDGTVTWHFEDLLSTISYEVHAIAEVIEGVSPMPLYPASLEFVSPPVDTPAGDPMPDIVVMVKDQNDDPYEFYPLTVKGRLVGGETQFILEEPIDVTTGLVTFSGVVVPSAGTYTLRMWLAHCLVADPIFSDPFNIT